MIWIARRSLNLQNRTGKGLCEMHIYSTIVGVIGFEAVHRLHMPGAHTPITSHDHWPLLFHCVQRHERRKLE